jgi:carbonic anhydrase
MSKFLEQILEDNKCFVQEERFEEFITTKYPDKKLAILACMDTRLTALLPAALNLKNGDVKIIKNAGGLISHPFGEVTRSLIVAIYELGVEDILVLGHTDCGMRGIDTTHIEKKMMERGITENDLTMIRNCGIELEKWLHGFDDEEESVIKTVNSIRNHPLIPEDVNIHGYIMDSVTGELNEVC